MNKNSELALTQWLVLNAQMGDADAVAQLFNLWYDKLRHYALVQLADQQMADDALHTALEVMAGKISGLRDPAAFPKWAYQILQRKGVDAIRAQQRTARLAEDYEQFRQLNHGSEASLEQSSTDQSTLNRLMQALPAEDYQLVHLYYLEELPVAQVASVLAIPPGTVKSRLFRIRQHFQSLI